MRTRMSGGVRGEAGNDLTYSIYGWCYHHDVWCAEASTDKIPEMIPYMYAHS